MPVTLESCLGWIKWLLQRDGSVITKGASRCNIEQERVCNARPATQIMIDTYMSALGFAKENDEGRYTNGTYVVWDVVPRNVLVDTDGDMYVVDAEITRISSV